MIKKRNFHLLAFSLISFLATSKALAATTRFPSHLRATGLQQHLEGEQDQHEEFDICIVGGSIAGLALSIGLQTQFPNLSVALVEKRTFSKAGVVLGLAPNGQKALQELDQQDGKFLLQTILKKGQKIKGPKELNFRTMAVMVFWFELRDALLEHTKKLGGRLSIFTRMELQGMAQDSNKVALTFQDNEEHRTRTLSAKLVVGADGVHSTVRSLMGLPPAVKSDTTSIRGTIVLNNEESPASLRQLKGDIILSHNDTTLYIITNENNKNFIAWALSSKTKNLPPNISSDDFIEKLLSLLGHDNNELTENLEIAATVLRATQRENILCTQNAVMDMSSSGSWGTPRHLSCVATLVGDAAHACRPTDGQGGNMALEDCVVFCRTLSKYYDSRNNQLLDMKQLVAHFEQNRLPRVKRIHEDQRVRAELSPEDWVPWTAEFTDWVHEGV